LIYRVRSLPRVRLFTRPTPLERLSRLSAELGVDVWAKRDDVMELALGGNKARKLEYILGYAVSRGYNAVVTSGALHSNHARLTAAAASKFGLEAHLVLYKHRAGVEPRLKGNMLLSRLFGARVYVVEDSKRVEELVEELRVELEKRGKKPLVIPVGGANELGVLSYVDATLELLEQSHAQGFKPKTIILATGTCATQAGLVLGLRLLGAEDVEVVGVSVGRPSSYLVDRCVELGNKAAAYIGVEARLKPEDFVVLDEYTFGGYGVLAREVVETMKLVGELEGLVLDPVYTGKAMHALIDLARRRALKDPVIFLHTGGAPVLFQYDEEVASL